MFRKTLALLLALLLLTGTGLSASAMEAPLPSLAAKKDLARPTTYVLEERVDIEAFRAHLMEGIKNCEEKIDILSFEIPYTSQLWQAIGSFLFYEIPEAFHVSLLDGELKGMQIAHLIPHYTMTPARHAATMADCEQAAQELLQGIPADDSMGDLEKALLLHDRLAVWCEYDTSLSQEDIYSMVGALRDGLAVCQGYAMAYSYLLRQVGMKSRYCVSDLMSHGWNIVTVDGVDYHVDVTWDDPVSDITGRVNHDHFLLSSQGILASGHSAAGVVDYDTRPQDSRYENAFWERSHGEFQLLNGEIYYLDHQDGALMRYSDGAKLWDVTDTWKAAGGVWPESYARLSNDGQVLLYSLTDGVYSYDPQKGTGAPVAAVDLSIGEYFAVYGFTYRNEQLICDRYDSPNFTGTTKALYQTRIDVHHCRFDQQAAEEQYLAAEADCLQPASYFYSCSCGKIGEETFSHGEALGHLDGPWETDEQGHRMLCERCQESHQIGSHQYEDPKDPECLLCSRSRYERYFQWVYCQNGDGTVTLVDYRGNGTSIGIPHKINQLPVSALGEELLAHIPLLQQVILPLGLSQIGAGALPTENLSALGYGGDEEAWSALSFATEEERSALEALLECSAEVGSCAVGDANGDATVNFSDIQRIYRHQSSGEKMSAISCLWADVNGDGTVNFADIQRIYQHLSGALN